jgi:electron transport complex protein RnfE
MFCLSIAAFVTICDLYLRAFAPEMSKILGAYVPLIIVNCIIIFRAEACASKAGPLVSVLDAIGTGTGFTIALCILASIREILATGNLCDYHVMPKAFVPWLSMQMPVGAFVTLGLLLGLAAVLTGKSTRLGEGDTQAKQETDSQNPSLSGEEMNSPSRSREGAA